MKRIVLAGGTGNLGRLLVDAFLNLDYEVVVLTRGNKKSEFDNLHYVHWDGKSMGEWANALQGSDTIINLSGQSIQCRFTAENKKILKESRIEPTRTLGEMISTLDHAPRLWINFSGISLFEGLEPFSDENSTVLGKGFLAELSQEWERAFWQYKLEETKQVVLRISPVLSNDFGMFEELYPLIRLGLGGKVGDGQQYISWITDEDFVRLVTYIVQLENPARIYHACTPHPNTNEVFMQSLRTALSVNFGLPLPRLFAKLGAWLKGVEPTLLLESNAVTTIQTISDGFIFNHPNCEQAFVYLVKKLNQK